MVMKMQQMDPTANMGQVGSSVLRAIQNNSDPLIDLFIRESIQNSLDAGDKDSSIPYVYVNFIVKEFNANQLHYSLGGITDKLNDRFRNEHYKFVAVKDTNTTGLTGPLKRTEVRDNKYGNLQKLVYHVGKPQDQLGAGGSWGYGKTLYYRISQIGLVIYYSRIRKEEGEYESRLCAVMCEDENSKKAILPCDGNNNKSGIAWWGYIDEKENTCPITNEDHIKDFLKIFEIEPYVNDEVGTIVIIPYINEQALLNDNSIEPSLDFEGDSFENAEKSIEDELNIAIQRWYSPRLNNPQYQSHYERYGKKVKYLKASINGEEITTDQMLPIFKHIQELYNSALKKMDNEAILNEKAYTEVIRYYSTDVGVLAYTLIKKEDLIPNAKSPYPFLNIDNENSQENTPIICMTRQPGMIVEYNPASWSPLPKTNDEDYILAFFVLNSIQKLSFSDGTVREIELEEYVRQSECADHLGWQDHSIDNYSRKINCIGKITSRCVYILNEKFSTKTENEETNTLSGLSGLLGKILSITPSKKGTGGGHSQSNEHQKEENGIKYIIGEDIVYTQNSLSFTIKARSKDKKGISKATLLLGTMVDSSFISCDKWERDTGLVSPFAIEDYSINDFQNVDSFFDISLIKTTKHGETYGLKFASNDNEKHVFSAGITITISLKRKDLRPNIKF